MEREEVIWKWRQKLRPYVSDVMERLTAEETRRARYEAIRERKRRIKPSIPNK